MLLVPGIFCPSSDSKESRGSLRALVSSAVCCLQCLVQLQPQRMLLGQQQQRLHLARQQQHPRLAQQHHSVPQGKDLRWQMTL